MAACDAVLVSVRRLQPEQAPPAVPAAEIGDLREEPLQAKPLPEDVHVRAVSQEALLGALGFEEPLEALRRRGQVEVHVRDHVLKERQVVWPHCAV